MLHGIKILIFQTFASGKRCLYFRKIKIIFVFRSACTIFVPDFKSKYNCIQ